MSHTLILRNRSFTLLWISQITSQLTVHIMNFLLILKMYESTQSTVATSLLWLAYASPSLIVGPFASAYTDSTDKKRVLIYSNALQSIVVFVSAFFVVTNIQSAYFFIFLFSVINQFYVPSEFSALPTIVKKKYYATANGLFLITQQLAIVVGFTVSHSLEDLLGFKSTLYICSALLVTATLSVWFLPSMKSSVVKSTSFKKRINNYFAMITEGFRYILNTKYILYPFICLLGMSSSVSIITVNMPIIAQEVVRIPAESSGIVIALPVGIGAFIGGYAVSKALGKGVRKYLLINSVLVTFILGLVLTTFSSRFFGPLTSLYLSILGLLIIGFSFMGMVIPVLTYLQEAIPEKFRGRVFGNFWFVVTIISIIPVMLSGFLSEYVGPKLLFYLLIIAASTGFVFMKSRGESFIKSNFSK